MKRFLLLLLVIYSFCAVFVLKSIAQPAFVRPDDEDFRIIPAPTEVITWGIGTFAVGKVSLNTTTSLSSTLTSSPGLFLNRTLAGTTQFNGVDVRPIVDYGMTIYAPTLFTLFGRNWGINLDGYLASYRFVTQYYMTNVLTGAASQRFITENNTKNGENNRAQANAEFFPKFTTTLRYLNIAPMLNISGFLIGANVGIPMPNMASTLQTPSSSILPLRESLLEIDQKTLQVIVEPRVGIMAPLISTRSGSLNFIASLGWTLPNAPPINSVSLIQRSNTIIGEAAKTWSGSSSLPSLDSLAITPLSLSLGFSYVFTFGNAALIDEFEREAYTTDSIRAYYATITRKIDSLRAISTRLADSMANTVIASTKLRDSLQKLMQARAVDSVNKAQEQRLFAERTRRDEMEMEKKALEAKRRDLEKQKLELESQNKKKDKELARKVRELAEKQRLVEEKQRQIEEKQRLVEETKQRIFEAKLGVITGFNEDGTETPENPTIRVEEFTATHVKTLVPRVFFDKGSYLISSRYKQINATDRTTYRLPTNPNEKNIFFHSHLLNIIAKRLLDNPTAQVTLVGFKRDDETDSKLALKRAEAVASYFIDRWKIPSTRIIREAGRPAASTNASNDKDGKAMSVLISSETPSICAPYTLSDTTRVATPSSIVIPLDISSGAGLKQWQLEVRQIIDNEDELLTDTSGSKIISRFVWNLGEDLLSVPRSQSPVNIRIEAFDVKNAKAPESPMKELKVEQLTLAQKRTNSRPDKNIYFYDLIYDATVVNLMGQQNVLLTEIKSRIQTDSKVKITVYNPQGVSGTAQDIAQILGVETSMVKFVNTDMALNPAQNNESKAYNNLVRIRIETPIK